MGFIRSALLSLCKSMTTTEKKDYMTPNTHERLREEFYKFRGSRDETIAADDMKIANWWIKKLTKTVNEELDQRDKCFRYLDAYDSKRRNGWVPLFYKKFPVVSFDWSERADDVKVFIHKLLNQELLLLEEEIMQKFLEVCRESQSAGNPGGPIDYIEVQRVILPLFKSKRREE